MGGENAKRIVRLTCVMNGSSEDNPSPHATTTSGGLLSVLAQAINMAINVIRTPNANGSGMY